MANSAGGGAWTSGGQSGVSNTNYSETSNNVDFWQEPFGVLPPLTWPGSKLGLPYLWWEDDAWLEKNFHIDGYDKLRKLNAQERTLVGMYPTAALSININKDKAEAETIRRFGINGLNDKSDAFRHAYFNALNQRDCGRDNISLESIAKFFSDAHESDTPPQLQKEKEMDLFNNAVGQSVGDVFFPSFNSDSDFSNDIYQRILDGKLKYLAPTLLPNADPNFWGADGTSDRASATHGITALTVLKSTNQ